VAVNCCCPLGGTKTGLGETVTVIPEGVGVGDGALLLTVTVAEPDLEESALLVAVTLHVPVEAGAVYLPVAETDPPLVVHFTSVEAAPLIIAVNCCVPPT